MMNESDLQDVLLMGRVAAEDRDAFADLFDRRAPVVLGLLVKMLGNRAEAEEVLQDVFLQVWKQARRYHPDRATPLGWIVMLARSRALDRLRSDRARVRREEASSRDAPPEAAPSGTLDRIEADHRRTLVLEILETLPPEQRLCLELAFFEGLSHSEIAVRTGAPLGTVKTRILTAMRKLRAALSP